MRINNVEKEVQIVAQTCSPKYRGSYAPFPHSYSGKHGNQDILDELSMSGLECVLFLPTKATNNYDNKYGVVFVGIRHASERVIQKFYDRLKEEAQIREGDDLLTPADILEMVKSHNEYTVLLPDFPPVFC